jgi:ABC-type lipoprotein export system ATPase subunit
MNHSFNSHRIRCISIIGGFLDGTKFELADGLNCFIGARGAGKTTMLEFVRYALDAMPSREEQPIERRRIESLVEKNLAGGRVEVTIETKDGMQYIVSRSSGDEPIVLTIDRQPTDISFKTGMVFGADIYSQNEVETIADCKASQLALLDKFQADSIAEIESRIDHVTSQLAANANQIVPVQQRIAALTDELATLASVEEKLARFGAAGGQDAATINKAHNLKALRDREHRIARSGYQALVQYKDELEGFKGRLVQSSASLLDREVATGPNGQMVQDLLNVVSQCGVAIDLLLQDAKGKISDAINQEKHQEAQGQAAERAKLERLRNELLAKQRQKQQHIEQLGNLESSRQNLIRQLSEQRDERFAVREAIIKNINSNLAPSIRVSISQNGNPERYQRILEDGLKNARVKHGIVAQKIVDAFVPWDLVVALRRRDSGVLIERAELNPDQAEKVVTAMANSSVLFELETVELMDLPTIELKDGETYKESLSLSTGQKCTTVLPLLLLESANPLLVDQPEDNLDNRFISEAVVEAILKMKSRRQMIFVTHNPNIPVLGDAERVFVLDSDGATARKSNEGTVDECKREIVNLLEGGENAFKVRKCRYAY